MLGHRSYIACFVLLSLAGCRLNLEGKSRSEEAQPSEAEEDDSTGSSTRAAAGRGGNGSSSSSGVATGRNDDPASDGPPVDCSAIERFGAARELPDPVAGTLTLHGLIAISGKTALRGNVVIEPGTTFVMGADSLLEFAEYDMTTLSAVGTVERPIRFCGAQATPGFWRGVGLLNGLTSASALEHALISDAGGEGAALFVNGPIRLRDVTVQRSEFDGIAATQFGQDSGQLVISDVGRDAMVLQADDALRSLPGDTRFERNGNNRVLVSLTDIEGQLSVPKLPVPYVQAMQIDVHEGVLAFAAGVDWRFAADAGLEIGWNYAKTELQVQGTVAEPVVFSGDAQKPGAFTGIVITGTASRDSKIAHARIVNGGGGTAAPLEINASITLEDVTVTDSARPVVINAPPAAASKNLTITGSAARPLQVDCQALTGLPVGGTFTGNAEDAITVEGHSVVALVGTLPNLGVPYQFNGSLQLSDASDLTIAAGVELVFQAGYNYLLEVGWNYGKGRLVAAGTAAAPIIVRGDHPEPGSWAGVTFNRDSSTDSRLDYVQILGAPLNLYRTVQVTNSTFSQSPSFGIRKQAADTTDYQTSNTFTGNASGPVGDL